tara:strand:+ start:1652 stop:2050 length:399 start_codon:yes stop_codon:yes gene_type:complete
MTLHLESITSGIICGIILLQTSIIAPTVFKYLDQNQTRDLLRAIFPKFFLFIFILGLFSLIVGLLNDLNLDIQIIISLITVILSILCYLIIPATNIAKDSNDRKRFELLHKVSVVFTVIILISNFSWIFFNR